MYTMLLFFLTYHTVTHTAGNTVLMIAVMIVVAITVVESVPAGGVTTITATTTTHTDGIGGGRAAPGMTADDGCACTPSTLTFGRLVLSSSGDDCGGGDGDGGGHRAARGSAGSSGGGGAGGGVGAGGGADFTDCGERGQVHLVDVWRWGSPVVDSAVLHRHGPVAGVDGWEEVIGDVAHLAVAVTTAQHTSLAKACAEVQVAS